VVVRGSYVVVGGPVVNGLIVVDEAIGGLIVVGLFTEGGPMKMLSNATASSTCLLQNA
jgi:hypothetical protein